jgi:hypothetical protein
LIKQDGKPFDPANGTKPRFDEAPRGNTSKRIDVFSDA